MMRLLFLAVLLFVVAHTSAQGTLGGNAQGRPSTNRISLSETKGDDNDKKEIKDIDVSVSDYKQILANGDTISLDTTLTIRKYYKYNYLRRDDFGLLPFQNIGRPFNALTRDFSTLSQNPEFGATAKHFNFMEANDISYYHVPTPLTEFYFKTVFQQGQNVDAFFTTNIKPELNLSIAYKGLRSLGNYQNSLTSTGNLRMTLSYQSKNQRYFARTHFVSQDLMSQENGGMTAEAVQFYEDELPEYDNRSSVAMQYENAESTLYGKRFYLNQAYKLKSNADSTSSAEVTAFHKLNFSDKEYQFQQTEATSIYGEAFENSNLYDEVEYQYVRNQLGISYQQKFLGKLSGFIEHTNYNYGFNSIVLQDDGNIVPNRINEDVLAVGGNYLTQFGGFKFKTNAALNLHDTFKGYDVNVTSSYQLDSTSTVSARLKINSALPNFNFLLYQSDYKNYNWYNPNFDNQNLQQLQLQLASKRFGTYKLSYQRIDNYTYFGLIDNPDATANADTLVKPMQSEAQVQYLKFKAQKDFKVGKFGLANDVIYQQVLSGESAFRVPELVTRQSLYYQDFWFKKALFMQTGITFNYFTDFQSNAYDPILSEFFVNNQDFKSFYTADIFFNAKVRTARIYFKFENFPTIFQGNTNFAAPNYAYRDFVIRFGLVWNLFL
ncbi:putative porin [Psychroflexus sp. ALD_RP9]|nr:putative porin [Psychroflexus sp. ALD_RP9]